MIQRIIICTAIMSATTAIARDHQHCRNLDVIDNNPFEEGLGDYGMPDVDGDSQSTYFRTNNGELEYMGVGQMGWDSDHVSVRKRGTTTTYTVAPDHGGFKLQVKVYGSDRGVLLWQEAGQGPYQVIGKIDCRNVEVVENSNIGDRNVKRTSVSQIFRQVRERIYGQDVAFEMGDGYYDVIATSYYKVYAGGSIAGYIVWYKLSYSEDPEYPEVTLHFDRNGLRLTGPLGW